MVAVKRWAARLSGVVLAMAVWVPGVQAQLLGQTFEVDYRVPNTSTVYGSATASPSSFTVGTGIETTVNVEDVTWLAVDFEAQRITVDFTTTLLAPTWNTASFNGLVFTHTGLAPLALGTASIGLGSTLAGFGASRVGFDGTRISLDWNGLSYTDGTKLVVDFATPIPEPATLALMAAGLGVVGAVARRRRQAAGAGESAAA